MMVELYDPALPSANVFRPNKPDPVTVLQQQEFVNAATRREGMLHNLLASFTHHWNQVWAMQRAAIAKHEGLPLEPYGVPLPGQTTNTTKVNTGIGLPGVLALLGAVLLGYLLATRSPAHNSPSPPSPRPDNPIYVPGPSPGPPDKDKDRDWGLGIIKDDT